MANDGIVKETVCRADMLLSGQADRDRPSLENLVAYQRKGAADILGYRSGIRRDRTALKWLAEAVGSALKPVAVLDVGCAYGNLSFMLNAKLGNPSAVKFIGVDLSVEGITYARAFSNRIPGYQNCDFIVADIATGLPFENAAFDAISMLDVLEHMKNPAAVLRELARITKPGGVIVISTPLRDSVFKKIAGLINRLTGHRLYKAYYRGKGAELDISGNPIMLNKVGNAHVSEKNYRELRELVQDANLKIKKIELMPILSGSSWFDKHGYLLSVLLFLEATHDLLRRPSWAHGILMKLVVPQDE